MANELRGREPAEGPELWEALARYVAGESPAVEAESIAGWLAAQPGRAELLAALERATGRLAQARAADVDVEAALRSVRERMDEAPVLPFRPRAGHGEERGFRGWRTMSLRAAAIAVLLLGASVVWRLARDPGAGPEDGQAALTYATEPGRADSVRLPDGTHVLLGRGSRLTVSAWDEARRIVELTGEALFDVMHDDARPFIVRAGAATIQDLGTSFVVRSDDGAGEVRVVVTSGSVLLHAVDSPAAEGVVLLAGDRGVLGADRRVSAERAAATDADLAWTRGRLVFADAPLSRVAADLRRWYGIELRLADAALEGRHLTATFERETAQQVLDVIALTLGTRIELRGDTAVMTSIPGAAPR
jgi:transmembrane sensor